MLVVLIATVALAPDQPAAGAADPETIIVTGERVRRPAWKTPSSVEVISAKELETLPGANRLDDVLERIPNVQFGSDGLGPTIRGQDSTGVLQDLPAFLGGTRSRVTLQVDGRAVGYNEFVFGAAPIWDVDQVEVFRSPQSTTQGRNSIAGAIFVTTRDPSYDWEAGGRAIAGSYDARQLSAVVSGPIVADQLAFRVAGDLRRGRPSSRIVDRAQGADPNNDDFGLLRFKLLAEPKGFAGMRLEASYSHSESLTPQITGVRMPFEDRRDPLATYGTFATDVDALTLSAEAPVSSTLASVTTVSLGSSRIRRFAPPGLGEADNRIGDISIEALLHWKPGGSFQMTGGVHQLWTKLDQFINLSAVIGNGEFQDRQRSLGLFGEGTVALLPRLSATAGLRYQRDRQTRSGGFDSSNMPLAVDFSKSFGAWLPKVSVAYEASSQVIVGLLAQRAYNPGGIALNFETGEQDEFGAERLRSYEAFLRARLLDGRLRLNANFFINEFRDAQRAQSRAFTVPGGATAVWARISNVPRARSRGLEASLDWRATPRLRARAGLGLLGTKIMQSADSLTAIEGREFQRAPRFTASGSIDWQPLERLSLSAALHRNSGYFSDDLNSARLRIERASRVDVRAAYELGPATLFGYARNVLDEFHLTYLFNPTFGTAGKPRQVGVGVEARF